MSEFELFTYNRVIVFWIWNQERNNVKKKRNAGLDIQKLRDGSVHTYAIKVGNKIVAKVRTKKYALLLCWAIANEKIITDRRILAFAFAALDMWVKTSRHLSTNLK